MSRIRTVQTNFTAGVLDEGMRSRIDLQIYKNGVKRAENVRLRPQGGATRRAGSVAVQAYAYDAQVEPFIFNDTEQYVFFFHVRNVTDSCLDVFERFTRTLVASYNIGPGFWTSTHIAEQELQILQQYDKIFISHTDFDTQIFTRTSLNTFNRTNFTFEFSRFLPAFPPMHKFAAADVYLTPGAVLGATTMTSSVAFWDTVLDPQTSCWSFRGKRFVVVSVSSTTVANVIISDTLPDTSLSIDWQESAFSPRRGFARCLALHESRLWIGGGRDCPNVVWGSVAGVPLDFDLGTAAADDAIKYPVSGERVVNFKSMTSFTHLQLFASTGEYYVPAPSSGGLTPANFSVKRTSAYGSGNIPPKIFDQSTIFVTKEAQAVREFMYDDIRVSYVADALTFMGKSMCPTPTGLEIQIEGTGQEQEARAYVPNEDGTVGVLSKVRKEEIAGWSSWITQGSYKRLCVVDNELWMLVERTINGVTGKYIEVAANTVNLDFSASAYALGGGTGTSWGPFNLHKGQLVYAVSADLNLGTLTVDATTGMITTPAVTQVTIGLNFTPLIEPLTQEVLQADGTTMGEFKHYVSTVAVLEETISCKIKNRRLPNTLPADDPSTAPARFTGKFKAWHLGWNKDDVPIVSAPEPLPFTLNSLVFEVEV